MIRFVNFSTLSSVLPVKSKTACESARQFFGFVARTFAAPAIIPNPIHEIESHGCITLWSPWATRDIAHFHGCLGASQLETKFAESMALGIGLGEPCNVILPKTHLMIKDRIRDRFRQGALVQEFVQSWPLQERKKLPKSFVEPTFHEVWDILESTLSGSQQWHDFFFDRDSKDQLILNRRRTAAAMYSAGESVTDAVLEVMRDRAVKKIGVFAFSLGMGPGSHMTYLKKMDRGMEIVGAFLAGGPLFQEVIDEGGGQVRRKDVRCTIAMGTEDPIPGRLEQPIEKVHALIEKHELVNTTAVPVSMGHLFPYRRAVKEARAMFGVPPIAPARAALGA